MPPITYDQRSLFITEAGTIYDLKLMYDGASLNELARRFLSPEEYARFAEDNRKIKAILKSAKTARIPLESVPLTGLMPPDLAERHMNSRDIVKALAYADFQRQSPEVLERYEKDVVPFARALYTLERNGVAVDRERAMALLRIDPPAHEKKHLRSMLELSKGDGKVYTKYTPVGGKTGRIRVESGFDTLAIPHGVVRSCIVSRFVDGKIFTLDYNAIDYRSIIFSIPELADIYKGCDDFHQRTKELIGEEKDSNVDRQQLKHLTYVNFYGGSIETSAKKTGLHTTIVTRLLTRINHVLKPISDFRDRLHKRGVMDGFVLLPNGKKVNVNPDDHPGKVLGLYAQTYSSQVFAKALIAVSKLATDLCLPIFWVHDELVFDVHPSEFHRMEEIKNCMEHAVGEHRFAVKQNSGRSYGEAVD